MGRTFSAIANTGLFVLSCFLLASTANTIFAALLTPAAEAAVEPAAPGAPPIRGWQDRQVILTRNLFNASILAPAAPAAPVEEDLEATRLPLRLLGTAAASNPAYSWAAVEDTEARETEVVRVGSRLEKRRAEVIRIQRKRIVLLENGSHRELIIDEKTLPTASRASASGRQTAARSSRSSRSSRSARTSRSSRTSRASARTSRATRNAGRSSRSSGGATSNLANNVQQLSPNRFLVERDDVEALAADPQALLSEATVLPTFEQGNLTGVQLRDVEPGGLLSRVGLKNGDVVTALNGQPITSMEDGSRVASEIASGDEIEVKLSDGRVIQFVYE